MEDVAKRYREMAAWLLAEADSEACKPENKTSFVRTAELYFRTALHIEYAAIPSNANS
jgi:hypothetical protein